MLHKIVLKEYKTYSGALYKELPLSYQLFGKELHTAPVVLVNHALTGNSNVAGETGWWNQLIGDRKIIDTQKYT
ncbi:MAG: homoserine acetyltransferase, partial [Flavobacteriaceae bacterium]|nr:homoserine acetyltransferase [Flavobacteriaceae bacterium]